MVGVKQELRTPRPPTPLLGTRYGTLVILELHHVPRPDSRNWSYSATCLCDCGTRKVISVGALKNGRTKSCGCAARKLPVGSLHHNFKGFEGLPGRYWSRIQRGATSRGLPFTITIEWAWGLFLRQGMKCALSGVPIGFGKRCDTASLDRIDSSLGYTGSNVQWVHKKVNAMKSSFPENEFVFFCTQIAKHRGGGVAPPEEASVYVTSPTPTGPKPPPSLASNAKITESQALLVIHDYDLGFRVSDLAIKYKLTKESIGNILSGRTWGHLPRSVRYVTKRMSGGVG